MSYEHSKVLKLKHYNTLKNKELGNCDHHQCELTAQSPLTLPLNIHPKQPTLLVSPLKGIQYLHRANVSFCRSDNTGMSMCRHP